MCQRSKGIEETMVYSELSFSPHITDDMEDDIQNLGPVIMQPGYDDIPNSDETEKTNDLFYSQRSSGKSLISEGTGTGRLFHPAKLSSKQKTGLSIFIALSIILVVAVTLAVFLSKGSDDSNSSSGTHKKTRSDTKFTLGEILGGKYGYDSYSTDWISDNSYLHNEGRELMQYDMEPKGVSKVISANEEDEMRTQRVRELSPDRKWLLFANNTQGLYRHSFYGDYYVKNMETNQITKIVTKDIDNDTKEQIRYCGWSTVENALIFVYKCNIYYVPTVDTQKIIYYKITKDGVPKKIFNGVPDWVYEEEILGSTHALEFSSDGKYLAYVKFDASKVKFYKFPRYNDAINQYTVIESIAYPKAGYDNPTIEINVVNLDDVKKKKSTTRHRLDPPDELSKEDYYYAMLKWNGDRVFVQWMNRHQNNTVCVLYWISGKKKAVAMEKHTTPNGWIDDDYVSPYFSKDGSYYITMLPKNVPNMGDFRHIAKVNIKENGSEIVFLTEGPFTVQDINCHNEDDEILYFRSTEENTRFRHVYRLNITSKERTCFSCGLITDDGVNCTYHYPQFSKKCTWVNLLCQGPFVPKTYMISTVTGTKYSLTSNKETKSLLAEKSLPVNIYYTVESDNYSIPVRETRPADFDPNRKYAVLFDVYGGPNTQKVLDMFQLHFNEYLVTSFDMITISIDARGSGYYGSKFLYAVYRNLGKYETIDAINVAKYLQKQSYVDPNRIAIWGWSYGGFYAATVLGQDDNTFRTAVAVAPVSDWRYYDTVYTERYMGLPTKEDNFDGYEQSSVMPKAEHFANKNFLLIHGTADDNVHFQNSAQLAAALINKKIKFRSQFFTDKDHGIQSRGYVYMLIAEYLVAHLKDNAETDNKWNVGKIF